MDDPDDDVPLAQSLSKPKKDTNDNGRNKDKAIKNPEKAKGKGPKVRIQLAGTAKSITTKPTRSEQRAQSQGNVEKMAACGEQLIKKTGITPARLKAHYKRCHDGLDPQTAGFKRREIGLCTTLVTGGAQDQLMELFGMRADHCKAFPTARMLLQNMHKTNAAFGDTDAYAGTSHAHETYNTPACAQCRIFSIVRANFQKYDLYSAPIARAFFKFFKAGKCFKTMLFPVSCVSQKPLAFQKHSLLLIQPKTHAKTLSERSEKCATV